MSETKREKQYSSTVLLQRAYFMLLTPVDLRINNLAILRSWGINCKRTPEASTKELASNEYQPKGGKWQCSDSSVFNTKKGSFCNGWVPLEHLQLDPKLNSAGFDKKRYLTLSDTNGIERKRITISVKNSRADKQMTFVWCYRLIQTSENWSMVLKFLLQTGAFTESIDTMTTDLQEFIQGHSGEKSQIEFKSFRFTFQHSIFTKEHGDQQLLKSILLAKEFSKYLESIPHLNLIHAMKELTVGENHDAEDRYIAAKEEIIHFHEQTLKMAKWYKDYASEMLTIINDSEPDLKLKYTDIHKEVNEQIKKIR